MIPIVHLVKETYTIAFLNDLMHPMIKVFNGARKLYIDTKGMNSSTKLNAACAYEHEQNCVTHQMLQHKANPLGGSKSQLICSIIMQ